MGTLIRTADAAGIDAVILGEGCADPYNPKVVRSTQGSLFHLPLIKADLADFIDSLDMPVFGTALEGGVPIETVEKSDAFALLVGNEGQGVSTGIASENNQKLYIPIYGKCESLNVGIAAGIFMYYLQKMNLKPDGNMYYNNTEFDKIKTMTETSSLRYPLSREKMP